MIVTTKLVMKYFLEIMVFSANQKVGKKLILGLTHHFIQMRQSEFNGTKSKWFIIWRVTYVLNNQT
jgi:hypothetical protein